MMKHINRKFNEIVNDTNIKVCNMKLDFDEISNEIHLL